MYAMPQLSGLGGSPTESDLDLYTFSGKTALQKIGLADFVTRFAIQFPPKFKYDDDPSGRWSRVVGANLVVPGTPGQALWEWTVNPEGPPVPAIATVLEQFVDHATNTRHRRLADGKGGSNWVVDPL